MLEKAGAKFYGTYHRLVAGMMNEGLYALTGMPNTIINHA